MILITGILTNLTCKIVKEVFTGNDMSWLRKKLSKHEGLIDIDFYFTCEFIDWKWDKILDRLDVSWEKMQSYFGNVKYYEAVSASKNVTMNIVHENPNISCQMFENYVSSKNVCFSHHNIDWNWKDFSKNPNVINNDEFIIKNIDKNFDWGYLTDKINPIIIQKYPNKSWKLSVIPKNTYEFNQDKCRIYSHGS